MDIKNTNDNCPNINLKHFGQRVRLQRESNGLTQEMLAERSNISVAHVRHIEQGKINPSINVLMGLCKAMDITPNTLLIGTTDNKYSECIAALIDVALQCTVPLERALEELKSITKVE